MNRKELEACILRLFHVEKWPVGAIARQLGVNRPTVRRVLCRKDLVGASGFPVDSALVRFEKVADPPRSRIATGVGDFRELHQLRLWGGAR
jgi:hypothetical protein